MRTDLQRLKRDTESGHAMVADERTKPPSRKMVAGVAVAAVMVRPR
jgi:hypothetical protein